MNRFLRFAVFSTGLAAAGWVAAVSSGGNPLALAVTALIAAFYLAGAFELHRFGQATAGLAQAIAELSGPPPELRPWLEHVPPSLRSAVRRRIEGEPAALPGPALTPYLAGLLVLLGMLGTFLGMVLTLRGTGLALENATDLQAVRGSLVAPVKGLGLAFGTSVAGVATSAALGLLSALGRRERARVAHALDACLGGALRAFSAPARREASLQLLQRQADLMPTLVDRLQAMMETMERQAREADARLIASQDAFHAGAAAAYQGLADAVDRSLKDSLAQSARIASATLQPVAEAALTGIARETAALHATLSETVQRQSAALSERLEATAAQVADTWQGALARHEQASRGASAALEHALDRFGTTFEQRSAALLDGVAARHAEWRDDAAAALTRLAREGATLHERVADAAARQLENVTARLDDTARHVTDGWRDALARHEQAGAQAADQARATLTAATTTFERHAASLLDGLERRQQTQQAAAAAREDQRAAAFEHALGQMAASLQQAWREAGAEAVAQQQRLCETMEHTARDITTQAAEQARATLADIGRLVDTAAEAPRAAAEVIGELRQKLSDSMARDNALLEERTRILDTLGTLLDAVNQAATEQRSAIDGLVGASTTLLEQAGARFAQRVDAGAEELDRAVAQVAVGGAEVASLGEAFGFAVEQFGQANDKLLARLDRVEGALGKSLARSDEQLAYYVAQAREVIDLSILSQKQILEDLQRVAGRGAEAKATA